MRNINTPQVNKLHYSFTNYSSERRYLSYYHQVNNILLLVETRKASKILIAGKGDGIVQKILEAYNDLFDLKLVIKTFDFAKDLHPDILGDLVEIDKLVNEQYDIILCCQVLEHLPLEDSISVLSQMRGISKFVILSVPYKAITIRGTLKVPLIKEYEFCIKVPFWQNRNGMVDSRHYWEIGFNISLKKFIETLKKMGYSIISSYVLKKDGYKYFIVLETGNS
jgi:hypothetical protein